MRQLLAIGLLARGASSHAGRDADAATGLEEATCRIDGDALAGTADVAGVLSPTATLGTIATR